MEPSQQQSRRQLFPAAAAAAEEVRRILIQHYGDVPWIHQATDAIKFSLHNVIAQLTSTPGVETNAAGSLSAPQAYRMPARTAEEVKASLAADEAVVSSQTSRVVADPAAQLQSQRVHSQKADPYYWRKQQQEVKHAQPVKDGDGEVHWLL